MPEGVVLTESGALTVEEQAVREAAGTASARVSAQEIADRAEGRVLEDVYGDLGDEVLTGVEGLARGVTFGLSDLLVDSENARLRAQVNPYLSAGSELVGAIAPSLVSGGAGTVGTLARLTPTGRLGALTARVAAGGGTAGARVLRGLSAGAIEGLAAGAGDYVSRVALDVEPEFSAEALLASAGMGALLGGVAGAGVSGAELGIARASRALRRAEKLSDAVPELSVTTAKPRSARKYSEVLGTPDAKALTDELGRIAKTIDDARSTRVVSEFDDLLRSPAVAQGLGDRLPAVRTRINELVQAQQEAAEAAGQWAQRYWYATGTGAGEEITLSALAKARSAGDISEELDDLGAAALARLDEARAKVEAVRLDLTAMAPQPAAALPSLGRRVLDAGQTIVGGLETAQDLGIGPGAGLRNIPVVGELLGAYMKLRMGAKALRGIGVLPATRAVEAAASVQSTRQAITAAIARAASAPAVTAAAANTTRKLTSAAFADVVAGQKAAVTAAEETTPAVTTAAAATAARAAQYLQSAEPKNPYQGSPWGEKWTPTEQQQIDYSRREYAVLNPLEAIERIMTSPFNLLEAEALKAVYPALYQATRDELSRQAATLARTLPPDRAKAIGRAFQVPLHVTLLPGYGVSQLMQAEPQPQPQMGAPSASTTSPLIEGERTETRV